MSPSEPPRKLRVDADLIKSFSDGELSQVVEDKVAAYLDQRPKLVEQAIAISGDGFLARLREVRQRSLPPVSSASSKKFVAAVEVIEPTLSAQHSVQKGIPSELANYPAYKITKELGRGGMGVVYLAKNIQMDRLEVLKVLNERLLDHEGAKERFLREVRAVSKLSHPNIVTSYSILPLDSLLVFVMEYVNGTDLHKFIHARQPLPVGQACSFAAHIAAGLQHAHERGLVHRDIKPANVIVYKSDGQLQLKILDFGLAKATSEKFVSGLTQDGMMLGTPEYMAPEQTLNAAQADIRADIYSLGCTLYCMLTGHPPFRGTHGEVLMAHAQRDAQQVCLVRPEVPVELSAIVAKMMAKDARRRYQKPAEVHSALRPFLRPVKLSKDSAAYVAETNTVSDIASPSRDTSVEEPGPELTLTPAHSLASELSPQQQIATLMADHRQARTTHRYRRRPKPASWVRRNLLLVGLIAGGLFAGMLWLGTVTFRTPNGTIVVENVPPDADILIDGERLAIQWNAGKDKAEISVVPGKRQVEVRSKGLKVAGESVELTANDTEVIRVKLQVTPPPALEPPPLSADEKTDTIAGATTEINTDPITELTTETTADLTTTILEDATTDSPANPAESETTEAGWTNLFDGATLNGWVASENPSCWKVEDDSIVATGRVSYLYYQTPQPFENFHLIAEVKATDKSNGGIYFHTRHTKTGVPEFGHECAVNVVATDPVKSGSLYAIRDVSQTSAKADQWSTYEIIVQGQRIVLRVDGETTVDYLEPPDVVYAKWPNRKVDSGTFALQSNSQSGKVYYRNLRVKRLPPTGLQSSPADDTSLKTKYVLQNEIQELFDGQTLSGWSGRSDLWSVDRGAIVGRTTANNPIDQNTCLIWEGGDVSDFELELEYQISADGNSGIQYRSAMEYRSVYLGSGYQADIDGSLKVTGANYDEKGRGILANPGSRVTINSVGIKRDEPFVDANALSTTIKKDDWNHLRIVAEGSRLSHYINGQLMSEVIDDSNVSRRTGMLALQLHRGKPMEVRFRNIRLRQFDGVSESTGKDPKISQLNATSTKEVSLQPADTNNWVSLFDGKTLSGWKVHPDSTGAWTVRNGVIIGRGVGESHLFTKRDDYTDFHIRVEARVNRGGNSGVCFRTEFFGFGRLAGRGYEAAIEGSTTKAQTGSLMHLDRAYVLKEQLIPPEKWFTLEVIAVNNRIEIRVDNRTTVIAEDSSYSRGHIALQQLYDATEVHFRKVEVKEL